MFRPSLLMLCSLVIGCSRASSAAPDELLELRYQSVPGQVTFAELAEDLGYLAPLTLRAVGTTFSGPADIQTVATGDSDLGAAFNGAVINLIAAGAPIQAVIGSYGVDEQSFAGCYVLEGSPIRSARDLLGKKVAMNTLGAHAELILREYLLRHGLSAAEAKQVELIALPPVNIEQALRAGQVQLAIMSNTIRDKALERGGLRALFTDYELYGTFTAGSYVMHQRFLREHPREARKFVDGVARAIEWARTTPREQVVARQQAIARRSGNEKAVEIVKYWRTPGIAGKGGVISEREFTTWLEWLERDRTIKPGQVALTRLYTNELNPFRQ